jgi:S-DNA-T family DNA segregation ATPase FtsK/SpoIIIE
VDHCEECGFTYDQLPVEEIAGTLRSLPHRYEELLATAGSAIHAHPVAGVWSALEYTCHFRDVLTVQRERLELALVEEGPIFIPMGREERVVQERYNEQELATVLEQLTRAAQSLAHALEALDDSQWIRVGVYNWPTKAERTMSWLGRHTVHEGVHHLMDVERVIRAALEAEA